MRAKRKALHDSGASKARSAKLLALATPPQELRDGVKPEDLARLENEGGASHKIQGGVAAVAKGVSD